MLRPSPLRLRHNRDQFVVEVTPSMRSLREHFSDTARLFNLWTIAFQPVIDSACFPVLRQYLLLYGFPDGYLDPIRTLWFDQWWTLAPDHSLLGSVFFSFPCQIGVRPPRLRHLVHFCFKETLSIDNQWVCAALRSKTEPWRSSNHSKSCVVRTAGWIADSSG